MRGSKLVLHAVVVCLVVCTTLAWTSEARGQNEKRVAGTYYRLPLSFEANQGQADAEVAYVSRGSGFALFLTRSEAVLALRPAKKAAGAATVRLQWMGGNKEPRIAAENEFPGKINYLRGRDRSGWHTNVPIFARVRYHGIYPGIDLAFHGRQSRMEYDFVVAPRADPTRIRLHIDGASRLRIGPEGDLMISMPGGELRQHRPFAYQQIGNARRQVEAKYVMLAADKVGFEIGGYEHSRPLVIDPVLSYSTYLGSSSADSGTSIAVDSYGRAYVTGTTFFGFPTKNPLQGNQPTGDAFVTKLWATGGGLIYSTYLGGNGSDQGTGIAVDRDGYAYVVGNTQSTDFPTTTGAYQRSNHGGGDVFVSKLNPSGSGLVYSTYLGGMRNDEANSMTIDDSHRVYVTGATMSADFPLANPARTAFYPSNTAFVTRLTGDGAALEYSTYLGEGQGAGIAVDSYGRAYVTGTTFSFDFPVTPGAFQPNHSSCDPNVALQCADAFVTKLWATGGGLIYSTYLGGTGADLAGGIAVDSQGRAYVTGTTTSMDFPTTAKAFQPSHSPVLAGETPDSDAYVTRLNAYGSGLSYSTYLGGRRTENCGGQDEGHSIAVDSTYHAYVTGLTDSDCDFPVKSAIQTQGGIFVTKLWATGGGLIYSTHIGGTELDQVTAVRLDGSGNAYVTGSTTSSDFTTTPGAFDRTKNGAPSDAFVVKISN